MPKIRAAGHHTKDKFSVHTRETRREDQEPHPRAGPDAHRLDQHSIHAPLTHKQSILSGTPKWRRRVEPHRVFSETKAMCMGMRGAHLQVVGKGKGLTQPVQLDVARARESNKELTPVVRVGRVEHRRGETEHG